MEKITLIIKEFTEYPGPRYSNQGEDSGEDFYHNLLNKKFEEAIRNNKKLEINLDGTAGYASSFLDEAFGNLVFDFGFDFVKSNIEIISIEEPDWKNMIFNETMKEWENRRLENRLPKKTKQHNKWFKLKDGNINCKVWIV